MKNRVRLQESSVIYTMTMKVIIASRLTGGRANGRIPDAPRCLPRSHASVVRARGGALRRAISHYSSTPRIPTFQRHIHSDDYKQNLAADAGAAAVAVRNPLPLSAFIPPPRPTGPLWKVISVMFPISIPFMFF